MEKVVTCKSQFLHTQMGRSKMLYYMYHMCVHMRETGVVVWFNLCVCVCVWVCVCEWVGGWTQK